MSSALDEDTLRTLDAGRETLLELAGSARAELKKVFVAFVLAFVGTVVAMRLYVWELLRANTESQLQETVAANLDLVARTPFDVILIQVKLGLIVGGIVGGLVGIFLGRRALLRRIDASIPITRVRLYGFIALSATLAVLGIAYAYSLFFPLMFKVLAGQAYQAGVKPTYGIVRYTEFLLLLTISFGLAAQVPLFIGALSYAEIVPYETFRDNWRYAILGIFVFGAVFSPPDPFTQIMWAIPLIALYAFSLGLAKILTNVHRARRTGASVDSGRYRRKALQVVGAAGVGGFGSVGALYAGVGPTVAGLLPDRIVLPYLADRVLRFPALYASDPAAWIGLGVRVGLIVGVVALAVTLISVLREPVVPRFGDRSGVDLADLDAAGVRSAPASAFAELSESEAVTLARESMDDDPEKAQAILDRWEAVDAADDDPADTTSDPGETVSDTAMGMASAFADEETDEDDIGGYLYDIRFILDSLRSRLFVLFVVFMGVLGASFGYLYWRGIEDIMTQFTKRVPNEQFRPGAGASGPTDIVVALHPVEVLIFIVKFSGLLAILATLPLVLYYAWPAVKERDLAPGGGDRRGFLLWGGLLAITVVGGSILGFVVIAPTIISYLVSDALSAGMVVSYRIRNLLWVIFFLTVGVGLFLAIVLTVVLFHVTGLIPFESMYRRWRPAVFGIVVAAALFTPGGVMTMFVLAIPGSIAFLLGLAVLWVLTLPRRLWNARGAQTS